MGGETPRAATTGPTRPDRPRRHTHPPTPPYPHAAIPALALYLPPSFLRPNRHSRAPHRHSCAGRNHHHTPTSPNSCYAYTRTGVPNHASPPQHRHRAPHATPGNRALANADQSLTKVDKGCQKLTPSTPAPTPNPSKTRQSRSHTRHPGTSSVNPRCQPLQHTRTNLNNPEQIRTNPNTAKRPDQIGMPPGSPPNTPKKQNPEHRRRHSPSFLRRQEPSACDGCSRHLRRPAARLCNGGWAVGMAGWVRELGARGFLPAQERRKEQER